MEMFAVFVLAWASWTLLTTLGIYLTWGSYQLAEMFPEGKKWYDGYLRILSLAAFASSVLLNPWSGIY